MISFFIPIRKGSKRVKNKNFKTLPGNKFGLTEIKIKQLSKFRSFVGLNFKKVKFEYVISTNCEKTLKFLKNYPWIKVHKRKDRDATDDSLDKLIKLVPLICKENLILWTHVTSPFFDHKDYYNFIKTFLKNYKYKSAFSADCLQKFLYVKNKGWISHNSKKKMWPRTQDLKMVYIANSAAFIAKRNIYEKKNDRLDSNPLPIVSRTRASLDIDDYKDFINLKNILKKN
jgi:CMP-N-acetylneuraminic acid synthetase